MKVIICIPTLLIGGTEIQTLNLAQTLLQAGHEVVTVCYFEHSETMIANYQQIGSRVVLFSPSGERKSGWRCIAVLFKKLRQLVRTEKPDVVHVQYMAPGAIPIILLKLMGVKKIVATLHTSGDIYKNLGLIHFLQRYCVKAFTCITELAEKSFFGSSLLYTENFQLKSHNHFTIYNALPPYIKIRKNERTFTEVLTIGVVSRLEEIKGMDLIIPAFKELRSKYNCIRLLIVGDGSLKPQMEKLAVAENLEKDIQWAGRQNQEKLQDYYDQIDILCMPSRSEGFGLTAIEGMARGCVVVASNIGGLPEVVKNEVVGVLHESENLNGMVDAISSLIENRNDLDRLSRKARAYAQNFVHERYSNLINNLYKKL